MTGRAMELRSERDDGGRDEAQIAESGANGRSTTLKRDPRRSRVDATG